MEPKQGYVRTPDLDTLRGLLEPGEVLAEHLFNAQTVKRCSGCGLLNPKKPHFKLYKKKDNPCSTCTVRTVQEGVLRWVRRQPFIPSPKQILVYQKLKGQQPVMVGKGEQRKPTTDIKALKKLRAKYHTDPLYPLIMDDRKLGKLSGTYIGKVVDGALVGGFRVGIDGRVHAQFTNAPSTLRTSMRAPNLQNLPR